mmetsp:Transcript_6565/g.20416  ORF Transcript_6565/g.20416 Transcript_6565/m.20416 type:complete len:201 (+) Transcript_6565:571-1173(+)
MFASNLARLSAPRARSSACVSGPPVSALYSTSRRSLRRLRSFRPLKVVAPRRSSEGPMRSSLFLWRNSRSSRSKGEPSLSSLQTSSATREHPRCRLRLLPTDTRSRSWLMKLVRLWRMFSSGHSCEKWSPRAPQRPQRPRQMWFSQNCSKRPESSRRSRSSRNLSAGTTMTAVTQRVTTVALLRRLGLMSAFSPSHMPSV